MGDAAATSPGFMDYTLIALSLVLMSVWLKQTRFGRDAFNPASASPAIGGKDLFIIIGFFLGVMLISSAFLYDTEDNWRRLSLGFALFGLGQLAIGALVMTIFISRGQQPPIHWDRFPRTLGRAVIYIIAAQGVVTLVMLTTLWLLGVDIHEANKHQVLDLLAKSPPWHSLVIMVVGAAVAAPIGEEFFFRGVLQPFFISRLSQWQLAPHQAAESHSPDAPAFCRWGGILITSLIFAMVHGEKQHWPALMAFSVILGVARERFNNLLVPIMMHVMFNSAALTMVILSSQAQ